MTEIFEVDHAWGSQCQAGDHVRTAYPKIGVRFERCGGYVKRGVTWEGRVEGQHTLLVCDAHTLKHVGPFILEPRQ